jgi:hypothetical protein
VASDLFHDIGAAEGGLDFQGMAQRPQQVRSAERGVAQADRAVGFFRECLSHRVNQLTFADSVETVNHSPEPQGEQAVEAGFRVLKTLPSMDLGGGFGKRHGGGTPEGFEMGFKIRLHNCWGC